MLPNSKIRQIPYCHPGRRHWAHGLCPVCYSAAYREGHYDELRVKKAIYRAAHREEQRLWQAAHRAENAARKRRRYASDVDYKLRLLLRARVFSALRSGAAGSAVRDLGCSITHLRLHLELFWDEGMTWENWGNQDGQWSIDHIKPLSSFDLTDRVQFLEASHYLNLQPLWHKHNMAKNASEEYQIE